MTSSREDFVFASFPKLKERGFQFTSAPSTAYNCIAWAAGVTDCWWEPSAFFEALFPWGLPDRKLYWPDGVPQEYTIEAYTQAFASLGYQPCDTRALEHGHEKVAIFVDELGRPSHAARQLTNGRWTSKLGGKEDIEHALDGLTESTYGVVAVILMRPIERAEAPD